LATLDSGLSILEKEAQAVVLAPQEEFSRARQLSLYTTLSVSRSILTEDLVRKHGLQVDLEGV
jgi:alanyl-tRNA synthetase